jgi:hypothetical protein
MDKPAVSQDLAVDRQLVVDGGSKVSLVIFQRQGLAVDLSPDIMGADDDEPRAPP